MFGYEPEGRGFESLLVHQGFQSLALRTFYFHIITSAIFRNKYTLISLFDYLNNIKNINLLQYLFLFYLYNPKIYKRLLTTKAVGMHIGKAKMKVHNGNQRIIFLYSIFIFLLNLVHIAIKDTNMK